MRKTVLLLVGIFLAAFSFSGAVSADETTVKDKTIAGKISKVDCDQSMVTISEVKKLTSRSSTKQTLPDVTLKLTDKTKFTGVKECKEIEAGTVVYARYVESGEGNQAIGLVLKTKKRVEGAQQRKKSEIAPPIFKKGDRNRSSQSGNTK